MFNKKRPIRRLRSRGLSVGYDFLVMALAIVSAFLSVVFLFGLFQVMRPIGWTTEKGSLKPAAEEKSIPGVTEEGDVILTVEKFPNVALLGESNVRFLRFSLKSKKEAHLQQLSLGFDGYARSSDLQSLQLYFNDRLISSAPFFEAKTVFDNLNILLPTDEELVFEVKGKINEEGFPGDRLKVGFPNAHSFIIRDNSANVLAVDSDFPLWSEYISIIGNKKG